MDNIYILSEERPKLSVINELLDLTNKEIGNSEHDIKRIEPIRIKPLFNGERFTFEYQVLGVSIKGIKDIIVLLSKGYSSFMDFLIFKGNDKPTVGSSQAPLFAVEETKTRDKESRNTGVYQRASKFLFFEHYYDNVPIYMLYNEENTDSDKKPSMTSIFGTSMYKNLGVIIVGKDDKWFNEFKSIDELIDYKKSMRLPPKGNVPILIKRNGSDITISGRVSKPKEAMNIGHDPNIGALTLIAGTLRKLGHKGKITLIEHGIGQDYVTSNPSNKFLLLCAILDLELDGLTLDKKLIAEKIPPYYWKYEDSSEKVTDIFLHMACLYCGHSEIYENHAGSERSYFRDNLGNNLTMPKTTSDGELYYIPDVVIKNDKEKEILLIEGKVYKRWKNGVSELENYTTFETDYLTKYYPNYTYKKWVTLFSKSSDNELLHDSILMSINRLGEINLSDKSPSWLVNVLKDVKD